jgi:L-threonylcarbamoyladenylate synthase
MNKFLPGPLTLIVPAAPSLNPRLHGGSGWIGLRMSSHPIAQSLAAAFGPITTTSANPSGQPPALSDAQVRSYFGDRDDVAFLSGGDLPPSKGSTVIKVLPKGLELIREGDLPFSEIESEFESR